MTDAYGAIVDVLRGTVVHSPTTYSWFGVRSQDLPARVKRTVGSEVARAYLLSQLASQLYRDFYCQGRAGPSVQVATVFAGPVRERFAARLSAANTGAGCWSTGWTVRSHDGPDLVVEREGLSLWVNPHALPDEGGPGGTNLRLPLPNGSLGVLPGFYLALGDRELPRDETADIVRLYWNLIADGAAVLLRQATTELNRAGVPFRLKVLDSPDGYVRCDAGVLYFRKDDYRAVAEVAARIYPDVAAGLKDRTPAFTKTLAPGLGLAEDPGPAESFGQNRCRLLADGIIRAFERRTASDDRLSIVAARFAEENFNLGTPFLNPGSIDTYGLPPIRRSHPRAVNPAEPPAEGQRPCDAGRLLAAAERIGRQFVDEAVWDGDRCNWISLEPPEVTGPTRSAGAIHHALGPAVYGGTSGVAMFLSQLYAAAGDPAVRRVASGAIRQALSRVDAVPPEARLGLFTGWTGVALAAVRAATMLDEPELLEQGRSLLDRLLREPADEAEFDIVTGQAGTILALLALRDLLDAPALETHAVRIGDKLLESAEVSDTAFSWRTTSYPTVHNLNGYSHGAAGAGHALVELFEATGDERYRHAAEGAFRYERQWFDADEANWPNLLDNYTGRRRRKQGPFPFMSAWCHGAPGIAVSRIRAYAILGDEALYKEAAIALQTTRDAVSGALLSGIANYSLCHGLAGNADVLLLGWQAFGSDQSESLSAAHEVARVGIEQYGEQGRPWPCLSTGEESLPLMLGLAGIGYFLLRLRDPDIPSILLTHPVHTGRANSSTR